MLFLIRLISTELTSLSSDFKNISTLLKQS